MPTAEERIHTEAVLHRIRLNRYSTTVVRQVMAQLKRIEKSVSDRLLTQAEDSLAGTRLQQVLDEVHAIQTEGWAVVHHRLTGDLTDLSKVEQAFAERLVAFGADEASSSYTARPAFTQVMAAVQSRPFQGRLLREWMAGAEEGAKVRVREAIRQGYIDGSTTADIVRRIRGTKALQYRDGIMEIGRRGAEAMVRTAITHTANVAHEEVFKANADVITGVIWTSTLDTRTTLVCISRSEHVYPVGKGPRPPAHIGCRSVMRPQVKPIPGVPPMKAMSYPEWLAKQSPKVQDEILGPARGALYRTGGLKVEKFTDPAGRTLSLAELRAKGAEPFEAAGLNNPVKPPRGQPKDEIAKFLADDLAQTSMLTRLYREQGGLEPNLARVRQAAVREGWTAQENDLASIRYYTGEGYRPINMRMRETGGTLQDRQFTAMAARGLLDLPDEAGPVWRKPLKHQDAADRWWEKATIGEPLDLGNQLQSFTRSKDFAAYWGKTDLLLRINRPKHGAYIEPITLNPDEHEVLFPPGLAYRVIEKREEQVGGRLHRIIVLEVED